MKEHRGAATAMPFGKKNVHFLHFEHPTPKGNYTATHTTKKNLTIASLLRNRQILFL